MESFTESLNRLKEVHENEVRGEYHGAGVCGPHLVWPLLRVSSNSCQTWGPRLPGPDKAS